MAVKGCKTKFFIDEIPLSLSTTDFTYSNTVSVIEYNTLQVCHVLKLPSISTPTITANGIIVDASDTDDFRAKVQEHLDSTSLGVVTWMLDTDDTQPVGGAFNTGFVSEMTVDTPIDNLLAVQSKWENVDIFVSGLFLSNEEVASATGELTNFAEFGAAGSGGGI